MWERGGEREGKARERGKRGDRERVFDKTMKESPSYESRLEGFFTSLGRFFPVLTPRFEGGKRREGERKRERGGGRDGGEGEGGTLKKRLGVWEELRERSEGSPGLISEERGEEEEKRLRRRGQSVEREWREVGEGKRGERRGEREGRGKGVEKGGGRERKEGGREREKGEGERKRGGGEGRERGREREGCERERAIARADDDDEVRCSPTTSPQPFFTPPTPFFPLLASAVGGGEVKSILESGAARDVGTFLQVKTTESCTEIMVL